MRLKKTVVSLSHTGWAYHSETTECEVKDGKYIITFADKNQLTLAKDDLDKPRCIQKNYFAVPIISLYAWTVESKNPTEQLQSAIKQIIDIYRVNLDLILRGLLRS